MAAPFFGADAPGFDPVLGAFCAKTLEVDRHKHNVTLTACRKDSIVDVLIFSPT